MSGEQLPEENSPTTSPNTGQVTYGTLGPASHTPISLHKKSPSLGDCHDKDFASNEDQNCHADPRLDEKGSGMEEETESGKLEQHKRFLDRLGQRWFTVEPVVIACNLAITAVSPTMQQYIHHRLALEHNITTSLTTNLSQYEQCLQRGQDEANNTSLAEHEFQEEQSMWNTVLVVARETPILLVFLLVGSLSDTRGRRWGMLPQILFQILFFSINATVCALDLPLWVLPINDIIIGMTGSLAVVFMSAYAYIADIYPPRKRLLRLVITEIAMGLGALLSGVTVGWIIDHWGYVVPNVILAGMMMLLFFYILFCVPETVLHNPDALPISCSSLVKELPQLWVKGNHVKGILPVVWLCFWIMFANRYLHLQTHTQKRKCRQYDCPSRHWGRWSLPSTSPMTTRTVILTTFPFQCIP